MAYIHGRTRPKVKPFLIEATLFLTQIELKTYHKQNLASLNKSMCTYGDHVICDVTGLLKMISEMGQ